ncbi:MAG TPA: hypothetical protein DEP84_19620, partial [Chloroflexi bacterium]|nr:hypothetical protein [Chloroflexota bacterium]
AELPRSNDGAWASRTVELEGFVSSNAAFPSMTDLKVAGENVVLTHAAVEVAASAAPVAPTPEPSSSPVAPTVQPSPSSTIAPAATASPSPTQATGQLPTEGTPEAVALATRVAEMDVRLGHLEQRQSAVERLLDHLEQILTEGLQRLTSN